MDKDYILLYDGLCGLCNSSVQLILRYDKKNTMRFAPLQNHFSRSIMERNPDLRTIDSLILIEEAGTPEEKIFIRSSAALTIAGYLGGYWKIFLIFSLLPLVLRDALYDLVTRHRYRFFGTYETCPLPSQETKSRFIG